MRRSLVMLVVGVVATVALSASSAFGDGGRDRASSTVTARFDSTPMEFIVEGRVGSRLESCERRRRVVIFRTNATAQPTDDIRVAGGRTNARGRYAIGVGDLIAVDDYYAKVNRFRSPRVVCGGDRSPATTPAGDQDRVSGIAHSSGR